jgi:hypothetical protein
MNAFVEFTRRDRGPKASMAIHVSLIKAVESADTADCARVILFEKFEGQDYYWTMEPHAVIRDPYSQSRRNCARTINDRSVVVMTDGVFQT